MRLILSRRDKGWGLDRGQKMGTLFRSKRVMNAKNGTNLRISRQISKFQTHTGVPLPQTLVFQTTKTTDNKTTSTSIRRRVVACKITKK